MVPILVENSNFFSVLVYIYLNQSFHCCYFVGLLTKLLAYEAETLPEHTFGYIDCKYSVLLTNSKIHHYTGFSQIWSHFVNDLPLSKPYKCKLFL